MDILIRQTITDFREILFGNPWYGPSLFESLRLVPFPIVTEKTKFHHSILDLLLHIQYWVVVVKKRLQGVKIPETEIQDWEHKNSLSEFEWEIIITDVERECELLLEQIGSLFIQDLEGQVFSTSYSNLQMITGVLHHCIYHCGQINLLRRMYE